MPVRELHHAAMLTNPRAGTPCRIHYARTYAHMMPHQGAFARVILASQAKAGRNQRKVTA